MRYWTYQELKQKIQRDLDLEEELFIQPEELKGYIMEGVSEAEAEIHNLGVEDRYFLNKTTTALVADTEGYPLPADIYASKLRAVMVDQGNGTSSALKRIRNFAELGGGTNRGQRPTGYLLLNQSAATGVQITLFPTPTSSGTMTLWYVRQANRLENDTDICDIPFPNFVIQFAKFRCYEKEGHPNVGLAAQALEKQRQLMIQTLSDMVLDEDNTLLADTSFYQDHT